MRMIIIRIQGTGGNAKRTVLHDKQNEKINRYNIETKGEHYETNL